MSHTPPAPLRNYAQMVHVVRDGADSNNPFQASVPYQLGKAYAGPASSGAETRIRSLDEIGISSRSPNQAQSPDTHANYDTRSSTVLYHQLSDDQQQYFDGISPKSAPTRQDALPGTKTRAYLSSNSSHGSTQHITVRATPQDINGSHSNAEQGHTSTPQRDGSAHPTRPQPTSLQTHSLPVNSQFTHEKPAPKQTRLPFVTHHSLEGTAGNAVSFSLSF